MTSNRNVILWMVASCLLIAPNLVLGVGQIAKPNYGQPIPDFSLKDTASNSHRLSDYADRKAVVVTFLGMGCPLSNLYTPRLQSIADRFASKDVAFLTINSNSQDTQEELAEAMSPFVNYCVEQFGPDRSMFESNFPVDKVAYSYNVMYNAFKRLSQGYSVTERAATRTSSSGTIRSGLTQKYEFP